jgi:DNA-binding NarL/FixJ family response regulator
LDVLLLVADGLGNKDIAQKLSIAERTVEFHLNNVFGKLHAASRTEAVHLARQNRWLT